MTVLLRERTIRTLTPDFGDTFSVGQCENLLRNYMQYGAVIVGPSDCGYALWAHPGSDNAIMAVDRLLNHGSDPIPLSVSSVAMASDVVDMGVVHRRLAAELWPGQLTLVSRARSKYRRHAGRLHAGQTLGVRVSRSTLERQLAEEAQMPITTAAIRDGDGGLIASYDDAIDLVLERLVRIDYSMPIIIGVRRRHRAQFAQHSTVAELGFRGVPKILREGAVSDRELRILGTRVGIAEYGDAT